MVSSQVCHRRVTQGSLFPKWILLPVNTKMLVLGRCERQRPYSPVVIPYWPLRAHLQIALTHEPPVSAVVDKDWDLGLHRPEHEVNARLLFYRRNGTHHAAYHLSGIFLWPSPVNNINASRHPLPHWPVIGLCHSWGRVFYHALSIIASPPAGFVAHFSIAVFAPPPAPLPSISPAQITRYHHHVPWPP